VNRHDRKLLDTLRALYPARVRRLVSVRRRSRKVFCVRAPMRDGEPPTWLCFAWSRASALRGAIETRREALEFCREESSATDDRRST
jgi:hypothetical protein